MQPYTILVVEDDPVIRLNAVVLFEEAGFSVADFATADAAAAFIKDRPEDVGAVFTDVNMPGQIDGLELAAMIRRRWPDIAVLVTSARYGEKPRALPPEVMFIPKPWLPLDLLVTMQLAAEAS